MSILAALAIGLSVGLVTKLLLIGKNEPPGFIMSGLLGAMGSLLAVNFGEALGWYEAGQNAAVLGAGAGAVFALASWGLVSRPNNRRRRSPERRKHVILS